MVESLRVHQSLGLVCFEIFRSVAVSHDLSPKSMVTVVSLHVPFVWVVL